MYPQKETVPKGGDANMPKQEIRNAKEMKTF